MNRKILGLMLSLIILLFFLVSCSHSVKSYSEPNLSIEKGKVGILPFSSNIPEVGYVVSDTIGAYLLDSGVEVLERTYLAGILEEQNVGYIEIYSPDYKKIGEAAKVDFLLVGNVAFSSASARLIDAATGDVLIIAIFQPNKVSGSASAVDIGESLAKSINKKLAGMTKH
jgi:hypothetical protein